jgi:TatD DNase family protein
VIDTHAHLEMCDGEPEDIAAAAAEAGVSRILTIGREQAVGLAERIPGVWAVVGVHPHEAAEVADPGAAVRELIGHPRAVAVGECGLDFYRDYAPRDAQRRAFAAQIEAANEAGLPLVIHTRAADDDTVRTLTTRAQGIEVVLHCFSMPDRLDECLERGWWISFAGNVTYPSSTELAAAAERVPLDRLLLETDAPYLTPQSVRKHRNQTAFVVHTARFIAERRGIDYGELEQAVEANAARLFGW